LNARAIPEPTIAGQGLRLTDLHKRYGAIEALRGLTLHVATGETVVLLGPSGCGKSTVLRLVAGTEEPDGGRIEWNGRSLLGVPSHKRGFGLMFQDFALFPHMDVYANVAFGLRMAGLARPAVDQRVSEMLRLVGLEEFANRDVSRLSGGEQQRVALARSLAPQPEFLMLDEPLGSLDRSLRDRLAGELTRILAPRQVTALYVTHDQEEAFAVGDRVALMRTGRVVQTGTPEDLYRTPRTPFAARFLGMPNILEGSVRVQSGELVIDTDIGALPMPAAATTHDDIPPTASAIGHETYPVAHRARSGDQAVVLLRHDVASLGEGEFTITGTVKSRTFRGSEVRIVVRVAERDLEFVLPSRLQVPMPGEHARLGFNRHDAIRELAPD
jgi:ABC-type Fe3+/spermidine/putrescine transport system ATPase subunit